MPPPPALLAPFVERNVCVSLPGVAAVHAICACYILSYPGLLRPELTRPMRFLSVALSLFHLATVWLSSTTEAAAANVCTASSRTLFLRWNSKMVAAGCCCCRFLWFIVVEIRKPNAGRVLLFEEGRRKGRAVGRPIFYADKKTKTKKKM